MKKYISLILCALLLVGLVFPAYAVSTDNTEPSEPSVPVETGGSEETVVSEETTVPSDPTETTASTNPTETTASTDPTETTAPTDPTETTAATDPTETTAATDPTETTAATDPTETTAATDPTETTGPVCTCPGTEEEKAAEGFAHLEGCPYYVEEVEESDPYAELLEKMLTAQSTSEIQVLLEELSQEEQEAFAQWLNENGQLETLQAHLVALIEAEYVPPVTKSFTSAGPFMPPVTVASSGVAKMARMLFAMPMGDDGSDSEDNGLYTSKEAKNNGDGTYTITLEAYTTGTVTNTETSIPVDIVLVLDQSGSMDYDFTSGGNKQAALKSAVNKFIDSVATKYDTTADHRISIVTFGSNVTTLQGWTYVNASGETSLTNSINDLPTRPSGATRVDSGMETASDLIYNHHYDGSNTERQQVVIVFTDGVPTQQSEFNTTVADRAISTALGLKSKGVTVYTVGIFDGANPSELFGEKWDYTFFQDIACTGDVGSYWGGSYFSGIVGNNDFDDVDIPAGNRFLNYLSNNFMASEIGVERGTYNPGGHIAGNGPGYKITQNFDRTNSGYYLTAADQSELENIFQKISDQISTPSINLGSETVIKDVVTPYFDMPQDASEVKVYTADYDGSTFNERVESDLTASIAGDTVSVTGFNFDDNFVSDTARGDNFYGRKLIIEFTVKPKDGFLGGNQVPTNVNTSGVYTGETLVEAFTEPHVDVPIPNITVTASDKNVYLLAGLDSDALVEGAVVKAGDVTIDFSKSKENYGLDTWQYAFVDISSTGTGPEGAQLSNLREDTSYTLTVTVAPKYEGTELETTGSGSGQIYVFKPEITWQDTVKDIGYTPKYLEENLKSVEWKHGEAVSTGVTMTGTVPDLSYTFEPDAKPLTKETPVKVTVKIDDQDVTTDSVFVHDKCTFDNCKWVTEYEDNGYHFVVHLNTFDLTINKVVNDANLDPNQTFVFTVTGPSGFSMEVVIKGNGSTTIKNLPAGDYTVKEDTNWSWRYEPVDGDTRSVTAQNILNGEASVEFVNTRDDDHWLDGNAYCENKFTGIPATK